MRQPDPSHPTVEPRPTIENVKRLDKQALKAEIVDGDNTVDFELKN